MQLSVASIYFSYGSIVDNLQTERGASYKEMMRAASLQATADHALFDDALKPGTRAAQAPLSQYSIRDHLPPWLGGYEITSTHAHACAATNSDCRSGCTSYWHRMQLHH